MMRIRFCLIILLFSLSAKYFAWAENYALEFDGVNDYVRVADFAPALNSELTILGSQLTISAWIKTDHQTGPVMLVQQGRSPNDANTEYMFRITGSGQLNFYDYDFGWCYSQADTSESAVNSGQWTHICFVKDGTTGRYYINGILDKIVTASKDGTYSSNDFVKSSMAPI